MLYLVFIIRFSHSKAHVLKSPALILQHHELTPILNGAKAQDEKEEVSSIQYRAIQHPLILRYWIE